MDRNSATLAVVVICMCVCSYGHPRPFRNIPMDVNGTIEGPGPRHGFPGINGTLSGDVHRHRFSNENSTFNEPESREGFPHFNGTAEGDGHREGFPRTDRDKLDSSSNNIDHDNGTLHDRNADSEIQGNINRHRESNGFERLRADHRSRDGRPRHSKESKESDESHESDENSEENTRLRPIPHIRSNGRFRGGFRGGLHKR